MVAPPHLAWQKVVMIVVVVLHGSLQGRPCSITLCIVLDLVAQPETSAPFGSEREHIEADHDESVVRVAAILFKSPILAVDTVLAVFSVVFEIVRDL